MISYLVGKNVYPVPATIQKQKKHCIDIRFCLAKYFILCQLFTSVSDFSRFFVFTDRDIIIYFNFVAIYKNNNTLVAGASSLKYKRKEAVYCIWSAIFTKSVIILHETADIICVYSSLFVIVYNHAHVLAAYPTMNTYTYLYRHFFF